MTIEKQGGELALDDARRVKVLSPGMLVAKRFLRNRLAITGMIILIFMFTFAFLGGLFTPYKQTDVFYTTEIVFQNYATGQYNMELRYTLAEGADFSQKARAAMALAVKDGSERFTAEGKSYQYSQIGENAYEIRGYRRMASVLTRMADKAGAAAFQIQDQDFVMTESLLEAFRAARKAGENRFELEGVFYSIQDEGKMLVLCQETPIGLASMLISDSVREADAELVSSYEFRLPLEKAASSGASQFAFGGISYSLKKKEGSFELLLPDGSSFAELSNIILSPNSQETVLSYEFKAAARAAIVEKQSSFTLPSGEREETEGGTEYRISRVNANYYIRSEQETRLMDSYGTPSRAHILGLDGNGMDILTRLMYGGRVSLMVGFVVILIELLIGVLIGGTAGYFGGFVDNLLMRFIDLFNSIPFWPLVLIFGAVMDSLRVPPYRRIFFLMMLLGVLGWTGIARIVRGQILSLREQDFMIAAECTGLSIHRRIFRHLVPNVMPLLIVEATMGLGDIILTEATLSFLGLGVKYPMSSWGSILNSVNDIYVMMHYWYAWIPAGTLILFTVLGFNFVGDGLRDAFDPKMKR